MNYLLKISTNYTNKLSTSTELPDYDEFVQFRYVPTKYDSTKYNITRLFSIINYVPLTYDQNFKNKCAKGKLNRVW